MARPFSALPAIDVSLLDEARSTGELGAVMARVAAELGPIFRWTTRGGRDAGAVRVSMVGPEANRFVLHTHRHHFSHDLGWSPFIGDPFGQGLLNMDDPDHAVHRKMWNPAFTVAAIDAYLPAMQKVIEARTARWPRLGEVDVHAEARTISFDIAAATLAGFEPGEEVDRLRELFHGLTHRAQDGHQEGAGAPVPSLREMRSRLGARLASLIHARRAAPPEERPRDVLSLIVRAHDDADRRLSDEQVLGHLNILLLAGHETTTNLGAWALYLLSTLPEHRQRIAAELDAHRAPGRGSILGETLRALEGLDNFVRETGRLYPPVLNVPRGVLGEFEFAGYTVPAGAQARLSIIGSHSLPTVFREPRRFDPDRLAPPRQEDRQHPYALVTFGGGPRGCIGQHFAAAEVKALIAHVVRHFRLEPVGNQRPVPAGFLHASIPGGIRLRVRPAGNPPLTSRP